MNHYYSINVEEWPMKKILLRSLSLAIACILILAMFAGCGKESAKKTEDTPVSSGSESLGETTQETPAESNVYPENGLPKDKKVTVKVAFWESGYGRIWYDKCVEKFTEKFPNVTFDTEYSPTMTEIVKTKLAAGNDEDMYELMSYYWYELTKDNKAVPLDDLLDREVYGGKEKLRDVLLPGIVDNLTRHTDGKIYYLPQTTYYGGLFFDQKLFDEKGWNKDPKTWTEFLKLCEDIKADGKYAIAYAGMYDYQKFAFGSKPFELAEKNGNTEYINNFRNFKLPWYSTPEMLETWNRIYEMGQKGYIDPASVSVNHTQSQMLAMQHEVAMVPSGTWIENEMKDSTPEGFEWGFMAVPFTNDPNHPVYIANGVNQDFCIYSKREELPIKWAKEFMLYLCSLEAQQIIVENAGALPVRKDYLSDPSRANNLSQLQKAALQYIDNHNVKVIEIESYAIALTHPSAQKANKLYKDNNTLMAVGKKEPEAILKEADEILKEAVDAYYSENN